MVGAQNEIPQGTPPPHPTSLLHDSVGEVVKHHPPHDFEDSQDRCRLLRTEPRILSKDVSARSLCDNGAIALLCSVVDSNIINMIGFCKINEIIRYLHVQVKLLMRNF